MKILVTGGAGFIGSHTVVALNEMGYETIILDTFENSSRNVLSGIERILGKTPKAYEVDCNDFDALKDVFTQEQNIQGVIHFAAYKAVGESVEKPLHYYRNNLNSLMNIVELMQVFKVLNLVFSSSCTVYGQPEKLPVTEETPILPAESPYGNTKQIGEDIIQDFVKSLGENERFKAGILRYFNPIGAHPSAEIGELPIGKPNNLIPFITQTAAGIRQKLTVFGDDYNTPDGTCIRDYIHVMDLAEAHVRTLEFLESQTDGQLVDVFNLGTGKGNSVLEVIKTFEEVNQLQLNYEIGARRSGDVEQVYAGVEKATKKLNWQAKRSLATALRDAWYWEQRLAEK